MSNIKYTAKDYHAAKQHVREIQEYAKASIRENFEGLKDLSKQSIQVNSLPYNVKFKTAFDDLVTVGISASRMGLSDTFLSKFLTRDAFLDESYGKTPLTAYALSTLSMCQEFVRPGESSYATLRPDLYKANVEGIGGILIPYLARPVLDLPPIRFKVSLGINEQLSGDSKCTLRPFIMTWDKNGDEGYYPEAFATPTSDIDALLKLYLNNSTKKHALFLDSKTDPAFYEALSHQVQGSFEFLKEINNAAEILYGKGNLVENLDAAWGDLD